MTEPDPDRSAVARKAAELALVRVCHHYGRRPEFILIGGLVPELLCSDASAQHAGTSDVDVQVDLEIAGGSVNAARLERALRNADLSPDAERVWRWVSSPSDGPVAVIKFELLADLDDAPQVTTVTFEGSHQLGAANLRPRTDDTRQRTTTTSLSCYAPQRQHPKPSRTRARPLQAARIDAHTPSRSAGQVHRRGEHRRRSLRTPDHTRPSRARPG